jgi:hypothetical protein
VNVFLMGVGTNIKLIHIRRRICISLIFVIYFIFCIYDNVRDRTRDPYVLSIKPTAVCIITTNHLETGVEPTSGIV